MLLSANKAFSLREEVLLRLSYSKLLGIEKHPIVKFHLNSCVNESIINRNASLLTCFSRQAN